MATSVCSTTSAPSSATGRPSVMVAGYVSGLSEIHAVKWSVNNSIACASR